MRINMCELIVEVEPNENANVLKVYINTDNKSETDMQLRTGVIEVFKDAREYTVHDVRPNLSAQIIYPNKREHNYIRIKIPDDGYDMICIPLTTRDSGEMYVIKVVNNKASVIQS